MSAAKRPVFVDPKEFSTRALIFTGFLLSFLAARASVYLVVWGALPNIFLVVSGAHIHHFAYGMLLLMVSGYLAFVAPRWPKREILAFLFGAGLGLTFDEFGMWFYLRDDYWIRQSYDAVVVVAMILFNTIFLQKIRENSREALDGFVAQDPGNIKERNAAVRMPEFLGTTPKISVVVPAYNEERFISRTLQSLAVQDLDGPFEVIVVDNGSTDQTRKIAESFGARVVAEPRCGVGWAREAGFQASRAEMIATTDADTIVPPHWLSTISERFRTEQDLVAFGGLYRFTRLALPWRFLAGAFLGLVFQIDRIFTGGSLPGANMAVRRSAWKAVGGFNTSLRLGEDAEFAFRLRTQGRVVLDPRFVVFTSGRRFMRQGFLGASITYARNGIPRILFRKHYFTDLSAIRDETPAPFSFRVAAKTASFALAVVAAIVFFGAQTLEAHAHGNRIGHSWSRLSGQLKGEAYKFSHSVHFTHRKF